MFIGAAWLTIVTAAVLSATGRLDSPVAWGASLLIGVTCGTLALRRWPPRDVAAFGESGTPGSRWSAVVVLALGACAVVAITCDVVLVAAAAPGAWDALAYHLPRAALSLQAHRFYDGPVNYWAQAAHPIYSTALLVMPAALTGANEHAWATWQLLSYVVAGCCVFEIARLAGAPRDAALFSALLFLVLPQSITQAAVPENDMVLAAVTGAAAIALIRLIREADGRWLAGLVACIGLGLGVKAIFLTQLGMLLTIAAVLVAARPSRRGACVAAIAAALAAGLCLSAPAGYVRNHERYGNVLGPREAVAHAASGSIEDIVANGSLNTARLAADFISLDGLPRVRPVLRAQQLLRGAVGRAWRAAVPASTSTRGLRAGFLLEDRPMLGHETHSFWGIAGLLLMWPAVIVALVRRRGGVETALAAGVVVFLVEQGFLGPYDPWRGRYFLSSAVIAAPLVGRWLSVTRPAARAFVTLAVVLVAATGLYTSVLRTGAPLVTVRYGGTTYEAIWSVDRPRQLARNLPRFAPVAREFEARVPPDARVADLLGPDSFEYVLFGSRLQRRVMPILPDDVDRLDRDRADVLVFSSSRLAVRAGDVPLGADWWLRQISGLARADR